MTRIILLAGLLVGLVTGCMQDTMDGPEAAPIAAEEAAADEAAADEAAVDAVEAITVSLPNGATTQVFGYVCKGLKSACCEPIGTNDLGQTICLSKIHCVQNPISCL